MSTARRSKSLPGSFLADSRLDDHQSANIPAVEQSHPAHAQQNLAEEVALSNFYKSILDHIPAGIVTVEPPDFRIVQVNACYQDELVDNPPANMLGLPIGDIVPPEGFKTILPLYKRVIETGEPVHFVDLPYEESRRGTTYWTGSYVPIRDGTGRVAYVLILLIDTTRRKKAEDLLLSRTKELEALSSVAKALSQPLETTEIVSSALEKTMEVLGVEIGMVYLLTNDGDFLEMLAFQGLSDQGVAQIKTILPRQGLTGRAVRSGEVALMDDADEDVKCDPVIAAILQGARIQSGTSIPLKSKSKVLGVMNLFSRAEHLLSQGDMELLSSIGGEIGIAIENGMLFGQLAKTTEDAKLKALKLQSVLARNFSIQECERTRIARDLHDGVTQLISGALRHVEASASVGGYEGGRPETLQNLETAQMLLQQSLDEIHAAIFDLSPQIVESGLVTAIQNYVKLYETSFGIECQLQISGGMFRDSSHVERGVYRIIQEALQNVQKHAQAKRVELLLDFGDTELKVVVTDNGIGIRQKEGVEEWHLGLMSMQERALSIRGQLEIRNLPEHGTQLILCVPRDNPCSTRA